jgi:hypothetical protein
MGKLFTYVEKMGISFEVIFKLKNHYTNTVTPSNLPPSCSSLLVSTTTHEFKQR